MISKRLEQAITKYEEKLTRKLLFVNNIRLNCPDNDFEIRSSNFSKINWKDLFGVEKEDLEDFLIQTYIQKNYLELYQEHPPSKKKPKEKLWGAYIGIRIKTELNNFEQRQRGEEFYNRLLKAVNEYKLHLSTPL